MRDVDFSQFVIRPNKDEGKPKPAQKLILPENLNQPPAERPVGDLGNPGRVVSYTPPDPRKNGFNERIAARDIPKDEKDSIKESTTYMKKNGVAPKDKRDPVNKITVKCTVCGQPEQFYQGQVIVTADMPHVCVKCQKNRGR